MPAGYTLRWTVAGLCVLGLLSSASASMPISDFRHGAALYLWSKQLLCAGVGAACMAVIWGTSLAYWERISGRFLLFCGLLLFVTLLVGDTVNGSTRWLRLGVFSLQPVELAKIGVPLYLAGYCVRQLQRQQRLSTMALFRPFIPLLIVAAMLLLQPDLGATLLLFAVAFGTLFIVGMPIRIFLVWGAAAIFMSWGLIASSPYRTERLLAFLDPWRDPFGMSYQLAQSQIAIGSGGWTGAGLGQSIQKHFMLPDAHTDFIIAIVWEEMGLLGGLAILGLFLLLTLHALKIGRQCLSRPQPQVFHGILAIGLGLMLGLQVLIHCGAASGALPPKGITLPFFSIGGSSLIASMAMVAFLIRIEAEAAAVSPKGVPA